MQDILNKLKEWAKGITWENSRRYVGAAVLFVIMVVILAKCTGPDEAKKDNTENTEAVSEGTEAETVDGFEFDAEFTQDSDEAMIGLLQKYYAAFISADTATLETIAYPMTENEKNYIGVLAKYYEEIQNINYYSKPGYTEGSYFVSVSNDIKFKGIDTVAPALDFFYVDTDSDGKLFIRNEYSYFNENFKESPIDSELKSVMDRYMEQQDFVAIQTDIDNKYEEAISSDEALNTMISSILVDAIREWLGTATFVTADEAAEAATEASTEASTENTTETKEDKKDSETKEDKKDSETKEDKKDSETNEDKKDSEAKEEKKEETTQVKTKDVVNVRDSASTDGKVLGKLTEGVVLKKLGEDGEWTIVSYSGGKDGKGYIKTEFLKKVK